MSARSTIRAIVRWATWPLAVVIAFNIENAAKQAGYGSLISDHWKESIPVLSDIYQASIVPWVIYPALVLLGAVIYEWIIRTVEKAERPGGGFQRWLIKFKADIMASAFLKNGYYRKTMKGEEVQKMNRRLQGCGLPLIPETFSEDEAVNQIYGSYMILLSKGQFAHAEEFIRSHT